MLILTFRTDAEQAEIGLYDDQHQLVYKTWQAHRELSDTIHNKIVDVLMADDKRLHELEGIVIFKGPGSFTGLRIGASLANALSYALSIPICSAMSDDWIQTGIARLLDGQNERVVVPEYGAAPNITSPKH